MRSKGTPFAPIDGNRRRTRRPKPHKLFSRQARTKNDHDKAPLGDENDGFLMIATSATPRISNRATAPKESSKLITNKNQGRTNLEAVSDPTLKANGRVQGDGIDKPIDKKRPHQQNVAASYLHRATRNDIVDRERKVARSSARRSPNTRKTSKKSPLPTDKISKEADLERQAEGMDCSSDDESLQIGSQGSSSHDLAGIPPIKPQKVFSSDLHSTEPLFTHRLIDDKSIDKKRSHHNVAASYLHRATRNDIVADRERKVERSRARRSPNSRKTQRNSLLHRDTISKDSDPERQKEGMDCSHDEESLGIGSQERSSYELAGLPPIKLQKAFSSHVNPTQPLFTHGLIDLIEDCDKVEARDKKDLQSQPLAEEDSFVGAIVGLNTSQSVDGSDLTFPAFDPRRVTGSISEGMIHSSGSPSNEMDSPTLRGIVTVGHKASARSETPNRKDSTSVSRPRGTIVVKVEPEPKGEVVSSVVLFEQNGELFRQPKLPPGWRVRMSQSKQRPFYYHPDFGSTWHCPVVLVPHEEPDSRSEEHTGVTMSAAARRKSHANVEASNTQLDSTHADSSLSTTTHESTERGGLAKPAALSTTSNQSPISSTDVHNVGCRLQGGLSSSEAHLAERSFPTLAASDNSEPSLPLRQTTTGPPAKLKHCTKDKDIDAEPPSLIQSPSCEAKVTHSHTTNEQKAPAWTIQDEHVQSILESARGISSTTDQLSGDETSGDKSGDNVEVVQKAKNNSILAEESLMDMTCKQKARPSAREQVSTISPIGETRSDTTTTSDRSFAVREPETLASGFSGHLATDDNFDLPSRTSFSAQLSMDDNDDLPSRTFSASDPSVESSRLCNMTESGGTVPSREEEPISGIRQVEPDTIINLSLSSLSSNSESSNEANRSVIIGKIIRMDNIDWDVSPLSNYIPPSTGPTLTGNETPPFRMSSRLLRPPHPLCSLQRLQALLMSEPPRDHMSKRLAASGINPTRLPF